MSEENLYEAYEAPAEKEKTGKATAALVLGILSLLTVLFLINYILGIVAIILAIVFYVNKDSQKGKVKAGIGLGLAVISIVASTVIWVSVYTYFTQTPVTKMMEDIKQITGGKVDPEQMVNAAIEEYVVEALGTENIEKVETLLGKKLDYAALSEFVGEEVTVETIQHFLGDAQMTPEGLQEMADTIDVQAVLDDLGGEVTYAALEDKVGEDFTYDELMGYLDNFKK